MGRSDFRYGPLGERVGAALVCVVLGVLAGCDSSPPGPEPGPSGSVSASVSVSVEGTDGGSPTASPAPQVPALPAAAREASEAGARAFVEYYWELVNYAQATGDVKQLRRASGPRCKGCNAGIRGVKSLYGDGGHAEGGAYRIEIVKIKALPSQTFRSFEALVNAHNEEQVIFNGDGSQHTSAPSRTTLAIVVLWIDSRWRMDLMDAR